MWVETAKSLTMPTLRSFWRFKQCAPNLRNHRHPQGMSICRKSRHQFYGRLTRIVQEDQWKTSIFKAAPLYFWQIEGHPVYRSNELRILFHAGCHLDRRYFTTARVAQRICRQSNHRNRQEFFDLHWSFDRELRARTSPSRKCKKRRISIRAAQPESIRK